MADIWLIVIFVIPILLTILLRVNGAYVFLGICMGYVVSQFDSTNKLVTKLASSRTLEHFYGSNNARLILLLLPAVLILLFNIKTASAHKHINLVPAIASGLLMALTVVPLLPTNTAVNIMSGSLWQDLTKYQGTVVAISALVALIFLVMQRSKFNPLARHHRHAKSKE